MIKRSLTKLCTCYILSLILGAISLCNAESQPPNILSPKGGVAKTSSDSHEFSKAYKAPIKTTHTTLSEIVNQAIQGHPNIIADQEAFSATKDSISQARAGYMPSVDLRVSFGRENIKRNFNVNSLSPLPSAGSITNTRSDPSITIRQILFDGMGVSSRVARAHSQSHQAKGTLGVTIDTAVVDAASATIDVRRLQRLLRIVVKNIQFHLIMKQQVKEIVEAGAASISDLYQVEARLQDTMISKASILSDLDVSRAKFNESVGKEPPDHVKRIRLPKYLVPDSVEMAVRMALDNNNSVKVARSNIQIAEAGRQESASKLLPTISLELEGERDRNMSATSGYQNRVAALLVARHNLFNGGADMAKSRESAKRSAEAHARLAGALRLTERTIRTAWGETVNSRQKSTHLTKLIKEKRHIRDTYLQEFALGKRTLIDILDAANDVFLTEATRTSVDATTDVNMVVLSVGTGQFQRYLKKEDVDEIEEDDGYHYVQDPFAEMLCSEPEADLKITPYHVSPESKVTKTPVIKKAKRTPVKRKSIFDIRKEKRENDLPDKSSA